MNDLVKMIQEEKRNERPHPLRRVDWGPSVQPIYAISEYELQGVICHIEALEARIAELEGEKTDD